MSETDRLESLYQAYIQEGTALERNRKPLQGILGLGNRPSDDPCHGRFAQSLEGLLADFQQEGISPETTRQVLEAMYQAPQEHPHPVSVYWMLVAVQTLSLPLIPRLRPSDAAALRSVYLQAYPHRWNRLPAQNKVLRALEAAERA